MGFTAHQHKKAISRRVQHITVDFNCPPLYKGLKNLSIEIDNIITINVLKWISLGFYKLLMHPDDANKLPNRIDPEQSGVGLDCLLRPV